MQPQPSGVIPKHSPLARFLYLELKFMGISINCQGLIWIFDIRQLLPIKLWEQKNHVRIQRVVTSFYPRRALVSRMALPPRSSLHFHQTWSFLPPRRTSPVIASIEQWAQILSTSQRSCLKRWSVVAFGLRAVFSWNVPQCVLLPVFWYHRWNPYPSA